jgi:hypothetical protein
MRSAIALLVLSFTCQRLFCQVLISGGQSVRITSARYALQSRVGRVLHATADTVVIQTSGVRTVNYRDVYGTDTLALPVAAIDRLEVSRGGGNHAKSGALVGFGVGTAAGLVVGSMISKECRPADSWQCTWATDFSGMYTIGYGLLMGAIGAGAGAIVGSMIPGDRWEDMPLHARMSVQRLPERRLGLGVSTSF